MKVADLSRSMGRIADNIILTIFGTSPPRRQTSGKCHSLSTSIHGMSMSCSLRLNNMIRYDLFANKTQIHPETYKKNTHSRFDKAENSTNSCPSKMKHMIPVQKTSK